MEDFSIRKMRFNSFLEGLIYLKIRVVKTEGYTEKENFSSHWITPQQPQCPGLSQAEAMSLSGSPTRVSAFQTAELSLLLFLGHYQRAELEMEQLEPNWLSYGMLAFQVVGQSLCHIDLKMKLVHNKKKIHVNETLQR